MDYFLNLDNPAIQALMVNLQAPQLLPAVDRFFYMTRLPDDAKAARESVAEKVSRYMLDEVLKLRKVEPPAGEIPPPPANHAPPPATDPEVADAVENAVAVEEVADADDVVAEQDDPDMTD